MQSPRRKNSRLYCFHYYRSGHTEYYNCHALLRFQGLSMSCIAMVLLDLVRQHNSSGARSAGGGDTSYHQHLRVQAGDYQGNPLASWPDILCPLEKRWCPLRRLCCCGSSVAGGAGCAGSDRHLAHGGRGGYRRDHC